MDYNELVAILNKESEWYGITDENAGVLMRKATTAITDLLARAEAAEVRAEKAERERDAAEEDISDIFAKIDNVRERVGIDNADADGELAELCAGYCLHAGAMCYKRGESCKCENFKWRVQKEE